MAICLDELLSEERKLIEEGYAAYKTKASCPYHVDILATFWERGYEAAKKHDTTVKLHEGTGTFLQTGNLVNSGRPVLCDVKGKHVEIWNMFCVTSKKLLCTDSDKKDVYVLAKDANEAAAQAAVECGKGDGWICDEVKPVPFLIRGWSNHKF